jgi:transposase
MSKIENDDSAPQKNVRVYRYGLLAPIEGADLVRDQMRLAHKYRNTLTEIERGRRTALRALMRESPEITTLEDTVRANDEAAERVGRAIKSARSASRSRSETAEMREQLRLARSKKSEATRALRDLRKSLRPSLISAQDEINEYAAELVRSARKYCGLGEEGPHNGAWGSYLLPEADMQAVKKAPLYDGAEPNDPRFVRWEGEGRVAVQIQKKKKGPINPFVQNSWLRIDPVDERAWFSPIRGERRLHSRTVLRLRMETGDKREPVWAAWPMIMHRSFPEGSIIKNAVVHLRMIGPREEWYVTFTVTFNGLIKRTPSTAHGVIAIDVGWRVMGSELRVATWTNDAGEVGELRLDARLLSSLQKADSLRSTRDENFNVARTRLVRALESFNLASPQVTQVTIPEWLAHATQSLDQWRSQERLRKLALRWRTARFPGDEETYDALEAWRYHDHHLWEWETSQRTKSLRRRREFYRIFAAELARTYKTVVLEEFDLRKVAKRQDTLAQGQLSTPEGPSTAPQVPENETARHSRQMASISELRLTLQNACQVVAVSAVNTTRTCNGCGFTEKFDAASMVHHACGACGVIWDQDENAAKNLLDRYRKHLEGNQTPGGPRNPVDEGKTESRWAKAKRMAGEKKMRVNTTRKTTDNAAE